MEMVLNNRQNQIEESGIKSAAVLSQQSNFSLSLNKSPPFSLFATLMQILLLSSEHLNPTIDKGITLINKVSRFLRYKDVLLNHLL